jgi:hypothetical protein
MDFFSKRIIWVCFCILILALTFVLRGSAPMDPPRSTPRAAPQPTPTPPARAAVPEIRPTAGRSLVQALASEAVRPLSEPVAPVDLTLPYPFEPGRRGVLDPAGLAEVLDRFYGAALPAGWRLRRLRLPGGGRFELEFEERGRPLSLQGALETHGGMAELVLDAATLRETLGLDTEGPLRLSMPLPPGMDTLDLEGGRAIVNGR